MPLTVHNEVVKRNLSYEEVLYLGNDSNDLECMRESGLAAAVADAYPIILKAADYITVMPGGHGAIREIIDLLLESRK